MEQALLEGSKLRLAFQVDLDEQGNPILKTKTFSNIKNDLNVERSHHHCSLPVNNL